MNWRDGLAVLLVWAWLPSWVAWQQATLATAARHFSAAPAVPSPPILTESELARATGQTLTLTVEPGAFNSVTALGLLTLALYVLALFTPVLAWPTLKQRGRWPFKAVYLTGLAFLIALSVLWFGSMNGPVGWSS